MKFFDAHLTWLTPTDSGEYAVVVGAAGGRVPYAPEARWLYSLRLMLLCVKVELLWTTGTHGDTG